MNELTKITDYGAFKQALTEELQKSAEGFIRIGYLLRMAVETDVLSGSGYGNVYDFAQTEYGLDKSQVSRFININKKFSDGTDRLLPQFEGYGSSKLAVMLQIPDEIIEDLSPEYTKAELTAIKDEVKAEFAPEAPSDIEVMSEPVIPEYDDMELWQKAVYEFVKANPELYMRLYIAAHSKRPAAIYEEMAPAGESILFARVAGIGKVSISVNSATVSVFALRSGEEAKKTWEDVERFLLYMTGENEEDPPACVQWSTVFHTPFPVEERKEEKKEEKKLERVVPERKPEKAEQKPQKPASNSTKPKESVQKPKESVQPPIMPEPEVLEPEDIEEIRPEVAPEQMDISDVMPAEELPEDYVPDKNVIPYNRIPGMFEEIKERVRYMGGRLAEGSATAAEIREQADMIMKICDEIEEEGNVRQLRKL